MRSSRRILPVALALLLAATAFGAHGSVPAGYQVQSSTPLAPGVDHESLTLADPAQSVHVARVAPGAARLVAVSSHDAVANQDVGAELPSDMCRRVGCFAGINADFRDAVTGAAGGRRRVRRPSPPLARPRTGAAHRDPGRAAPGRPARLVGFGHRQRRPHRRRRRRQRRPPPRRRHPLHAGLGRQHARRGRHRADRALRRQRSARSAPPPRCRSSAFAATPARSRPTAPSWPPAGRRRPPSTSSPTGPPPATSAAPSNSASAPRSTSSRASAVTRRSCGTGSPPSPTSTTASPGPVTPGLWWDGTRPVRSCSSPSTPGAAGASGMTLAEAADLLVGLGASDGFGFDNAAVTFVAGGDGAEPARRRR